MIYDGALVSCQRQQWDDAKGETMIRGQDIMSYN